ncbi:hypothetical protein [Jidongwangia harbinensis]|uniref:hypothetical protein n=1 Tax=Jidongwangia harbinensis TaxID=2878561 RepID=UPI001CD977FB|nr:hypothetical protein [Jidongwangia harbinensis]MCA2212851.1 hypothetical protein [Jidongwangia harbinensis]
MSYPAQPPPPAPTPAPRRPVTVELAAGLLAFMGLAGLVYAIVTMAVVPGTLDRFRDSARGADATDVDGYVTVVWMFAALAAVLAVLLFALFAALAFTLRRGSNAARIGSWVASGLGLAFGCGSTAAVAGQRSGDGDPAALGVLLSESYPENWISVNLGLAIAQMVGYLVIAGLLIAAPGAFFDKSRAAAAPGASAFSRLPTLGGQPAQPSTGAPHAYAGPPHAYPPPHAGPPHAYPPPHAGAPHAYAGPPHAYAPPTGGPYPPYPGAAGGHPPYPPGPFPPGAAGPAAWPQTAGSPPEAVPGSPTATGNRPPAGPDDEFWARPSS